MTLMRTFGVAALAVAMPLATAATAQDVKLPQTLTMTAYDTARRASISLSRSAKRSRTTMAPRCVCCRRAMTWLGSHR